MGKQAHVRLLEHGKQQNPLLHLAAAGQKSPVSSTVSNLNSENPPDSKFEKQFTMTHQLLLCTLPSRLLPNRRIIFSRSCFGPTGGVIIFLALMPIQELLSSLIACLYNPFSSLWFHYKPNQANYFTCILKKLTSLWVGLFLTTGKAHLEVMERLQKS